MKKQFLLGLMAMLLPLSMWAADDAEKKFSVTITNAQEGKITYDGDATKPNISVKVDGEDATAGEYSIKYFKVDGQTLTGIPSTGVRNVGNYKIEVSANGDKYFGYATETVEFEVTHKVITTLTISDDDLTREYDGTAVDYIDLSGFITGVTGLGTGDNEKKDFLKCLTLKRTEGVSEVNVGSTIRVEVSQKEGDTESNYKYDASGRTVNVPLIITPKALTVTLNPVPYKGEKYSLEDFKVEAGQIDSWDKGEVEDLIDTDKTTFSMTFEADENVVDVKTYSLTAKLDSKNYTVEAVELEVKPAALAITVDNAQRLNGYYGYNNPIDVTNAFKIETFQTGDDATKLGLTLKRAENEKTEDGIEMVGECLVSLYNGENVVTFTKEEGKEEYNTATVGNYEISYTPTYYHLMKKGFAEAGFTYEINEEADLTYQGKEFEAPEDLLKITYNAAVGDMELVYGIDYTLEVKPIIPATSVKNAGDKFDIYVKAVNEETCNFRDVTTGGYKIPQTSGEELAVKQGELTITPDPNAVFSKVADGNKSGDLSGLFTFGGLKDVDENGKETTKGVLTMEVRETKVGTYPVKVYDENGTVVGRNAYQTTGLKNYLIKYTIQDDMYEILASDGFVLDYLAVRTAETQDDVLEKVKTYAGKEVNATITNRELEADRWYAMVLPFDIKASEISKALGYAVVNVPDQTKTNVVAFKLHVGNIEANTLFLVKLEDAWKITDENETAAIDFGKRAIVYDGEDCVVKAGENEFHGVYKLTELSNTDETLWYLSTGEDNSFFCAAGQKTSPKISPLMGYIKTAAGAAARFYVEEADGSTTAINAVTGEVVNDNAEGWYTVGGVKLNAQPTEKGIYINKGKKVVIK